MSFSEGQWVVRTPESRKISYWKATMMGGSPVQVRRINQTAVTFVGVAGTFDITKYTPLALPFNKEDFL